MTTEEVKKLDDSLLEVCMFFSNYKNKKRRESFANSLFKTIKKSVKYEELYDDYIVHKGAQWRDKWGGKWGNFYKVIYYRNGEFHSGCGFFK